LTTKIASTQAKLEGLMRDEKHLRGYGLKVAINGVGSKLLLDTGAGGILITKQIADKAGVKRLVQTEFGGIGNERAAEGYIGYADSIKIGELEFQNCYVDVVEKGSRVGGDGLIGADVFSHFLIDLNLVDAKFSLSPLPPLPGEQPNEATLDSRGLESPHFHDRYIAPEMKSYTPVYRFGHILLMQTHLNEGPPKLFLIDTGGFDNQISPDAAKEVTKVHSDASFTISGLNGEVKHVMRADDVTLQFAHLKQTRHDMFSIDLSDISNSEGTEISGILGFAMLYLTDIRIDYRDGLVDMAFDPKRWQ
jgi:predicted aspartyl protease